jgi:hypothetical protein
MLETNDKLASYRRTFRQLFNGRTAQVALLDWSGIILETNSAWDQFGVENGLSRSYQSIGKNYLALCESAIGEDYPSAHEAYLGLLEVMQTNRPKFAMVYPCHSPTIRQWYRMWVEPQLPEVPAIIVAHYHYLSKPMQNLQPMSADLTIGKTTQFMMHPGGYEKQRN